MGEKRDPQSPQSGQKPDTHYLNVSAKGRYQNIIPMHGAETPPVPVQPGKRKPDKKKESNKLPGDGGETITTPGPVKSPISGAGENQKEIMEPKKK